VVQFAPIDGSPINLDYEQDGSGLHVTLPSPQPYEATAYAIKIGKSGSEPAPTPWLTPPGAPDGGVDGAPDASATSDGRGAGGAGTAGAGGAAWAGGRPGRGEFLRWKRGLCHCTCSFPGARSLSSIVPQGRRRTALCSFDRKRVNQFSTTAHLGL
jgi:hypothetical protein